MVSRPALIILAVMYYLDASGLFLSILSAVVLHECAHAAALVLLGGRIQYFHIGLLGMELRQAAHPRLTPAREMAAVAAGPLANVTCAFICAAVAAARGGTALFTVAGVHLVIGLFNTLPAATLDGGRLLGLFLSLRCCPARAEKVAFGATAACLLLMAGCGGALFFCAGCPWPLLPVFLCPCAVIALPWIGVRWPGKKVA